MTTEEIPFVEGEDGGEEHGYRIPMNLRVDKEEAADEAGPTDEGREGIAEEEPGDEGAEASSEEEVDVTTESLPKLETIDLDALIDQEKLGIDKELSDKDKAEAIAKALGLDVVAPTEGPEGMESVEELKGTIAELQSRVAGLTPAEDLMAGLDQNPEAAIEQLAKHYGVDLGKTGGAPVDLEKLQVDIPKIEPGTTEDMPTYMGRLVATGIQSVIPQLVQAVKAEMGATKPQPGGGGRDPRVIRAIQYLDKYHPEWGQHQEKMMDILKVNPQLVSDPETLYMRASGRKTGREVAKAKKVKLKKGRVSTGERGGRKPISGTPKKLLDPGRDADFRTAWNRAKRAADKR